jgi:hypothetical protein
MPLYVKAGEIDRDNNPVGQPRTLATFDERAAAQSFIESEIARFDHSGFVSDGPQAGWWGRNDRDPFEKFHFWIDGDGTADVPPPVREKQYRGLP